MSLEFLLTIDVCIFLTIFCIGIVAIINKLESCKNEIVEAMQKEKQ